MTTASNRPPPEYVAEDLGEEPEKRPDEMTVDELWNRYQTLISDRRSINGQIEGVEFEMDRRRRAAHPQDPDPTVGTKPTRVAGEEIVLKQSFPLTYRYDDDALLKVLELRDDEGKPLITQSEWGDLVASKLTVNRTAFNKLVNRGGPLGEALAAADLSTLGKTKFEAEPRKQ